MKKQLFYGVFVSLLLGCGSDVLRNNKIIVHQNEAKNDSLSQFKTKLSFLISGNDSLYIQTDPQESKIYFLFNKTVIGEMDEQLAFESKYNKVIVDHDSIYLFLESEWMPNFNRIDVFSITPLKAKQRISVSYNDKEQGEENDNYAPLKDIDGDGYIEFGGYDLNEGYSKDSMYYLPSHFYELKKGLILFDSTLTKKRDVEINGVYLKQPFNKDGGCCVVVEIPKKRK